MNHVPNQPLSPDPNTPGSGLSLSVSGDFWSEFSARAISSLKCWQQYLQPHHDLIPCPASSDANDGMRFDLELDRQDLELHLRPMAAIGT